MIYSFCLYCFNATLLKNSQYSASFENLLWCFLTCVYTIVYRFHVSQTLLSISCRGALCVVPERSVSRLLCLSNQQWQMPNSVLALKPVQLLRCLLQPWLHSYTCQKQTKILAEKFNPLFIMKKYQTRKWTKNNVHINGLLVGKLFWECILKRQCAVLKTHLILVFMFCSHMLILTFIKVISILI